MVVSISYIKSIHSISHCSMFSILWIFFFFFLRLVYYRLFETTVVLYMFLSSHLRLFITFFITLGQLSGTLTCVLFCFSLTYLTSHTLLLNFFHFSQKPLWINIFELFIKQADWSYSCIQHFINIKHIYKCNKNIKISKNKCWNM